jgi:hypothetical protein
VKQSLTSGSFRVRLSTAATFGITENERGSVRLTDLGRQVADPLQETAARIEAFIRVPLYSQLYDHYKGYTLPRPSAVEKYMKEIGVSSKQTGRARQAFMRSARQAGFFAHGEDRLVRPAGPGTKPIEPQKSDAGVAEIKEGNGNGGGGGGVPPDIDPIIRGLLVRLPKSGDVWPEADRKLWLDLLAGSFKLIYKDAPSASKSCPECGQPFQGSGWEGIDSHWRANHENIMPYEKAGPLIKAGTYRQQ